MTLRVGLVLSFWALLVFNPHFWLNSIGLPSAINRIPFVPMGLLVIVLVFELERLKTLKPFIAYAALLVLYTPFAHNPGMAMPESKLMVVVVVLMASTLTLIRHPRHIRTIVLMLLLFRFAWFGLHGLVTGAVPWDSIYGNQDGYGTLMAIGVVASATVALAATEKPLRRIAIGVALLSMAGLVSSFARGAFMVGAVTVALLWYRADGRRIAFSLLAVMIVVMTVVAGSFFVDVDVARGGGSRNFWSELTSMTEDIADTEAEDRRLIWRLGWQVFKDNPVLGVGTGNWSVYASDNYSGEILGERFSNPGRLWGRAMHNIFLQELAEHGVVGFGLFLWMIADFWSRNAAIRKNSSKEDASLLPGLRTKMVATGFELSMVALLAAGTLYNVINVSFYGLLIANMLVHQAWLRQRQVAGPQVQETALRHVVRGV